MSVKPNKLTEGAAYSSSDEVRQVIHECISRKIDEIYDKSFRFPVPLLFPDSTEKLSSHAIIEISNRFIDSSYNSRYNVTTTVDNPRPVVMGTGAKVIYLLLSHDEGGDIDANPTELFAQLEARLAVLKQAPETEQLATLERLLEILEPDRQASHEGQAVSDPPSESWVERVSEAPPLPKKAPARWKKDRRADDTPPTFILRHYGQWMGKEVPHDRKLTTTILRQLDRGCRAAFDKWIEDPENTLPDDFDLPSKSELIDRDLEAAALDGPPAETREYFRLRSARSRRASRE